MVKLIYVSPPEATISEYLELMEEGKKTGYILKDDNIIALIGYRE